MCKHMMAEEGLMSVTVVAPGYEDAFTRTMTNMKATSEKLMTGEKMYLCGFCQSYGALHMTGANFERFETIGGYIKLVTSGDPAVVEKIHAHGQRTIDEYNKMLAAEAHEEHSHSGHSHGD